MEQRCQNSVLRSRIKNLQAFDFLPKAFAAENQTGEQYLIQDGIKELKHFAKTDKLLKILKAFLYKPSFCAIIDETDRR